MVLEGKTGAPTCSALSSTLTRLFPRRSRYANNKPRTLSNLVYGPVVGRDGCLVMKQRSVFPGAESAMHDPLFHFTPRSLKEDGSPFGMPRHTTAVNEYSLYDFWIISTHNVYEQIISSKTMNNSQDQNIEYNLFSMNIFT